MKTSFVAAGALLACFLAVPQHAHACGPISYFAGIDRAIAKLSAQASPSIRTVLKASRCSIVEVLFDLQRAAGNNVSLVDKLIQGFAADYAAFLGRLDVSKTNAMSLLEQMKTNARKSFSAAAVAARTPATKAAGQTLRRRFGKGISAMWHWIKRNMSQPAEWFTTERVQAASAQLLGGGKPREGQGVPAVTPPVDNIVR